MGEKRRIYLWLKRTMGVTNAAHCFQHLRVLEGVFVL